MGPNFVVEVLVVGLASHHKKGRNLSGIGAEEGVVQGLAKGVSGEGRATAGGMAKGLSKNTYLSPQWGGPCLSPSPFHKLECTQIGVLTLETEGSLSPSHSQIPNILPLGRPWGK